MDDNPGKYQPTAGTTVKTKLSMFAVLVTSLMSAAQASHTFSTAPPAPQNSDQQHSAKGEYISFEVDSGASYKLDLYFSLMNSVTLSATSVINTESAKTTDTDWLTLWKYFPTSWQSPGTSIDGILTSHTTSSKHIFHNLPAENCLNFYRHHG